MGAIGGSSASFAAFKPCIEECFTDSPTARCLLVGMRDSNEGRTNSGLHRGHLESLHNRGIPSWTSGMWGLYVNAGNNFAYPGFNPVISVSTTDYNNRLNASGGFPAGYANLALTATATGVRMPHLGGYGVKASEDGITGNKQGKCYMPNGAIFDCTEAIEYFGFYVADEDSEGVTLLLREFTEPSTFTSFEFIINDDTQTKLAPGSDPRIVAVSIDSEADAGRSGITSVEGTAYRPSASPQDAPFWCIGQALTLRDRMGVSPTTGIYSGGEGLVEFNQALQSDVTDEYVDGLITSWAALVGSGGYVVVNICSGTNDQNDTTEDAWDPDTLGSRLTGVKSNTRAGYKANMLALTNYIRSRWESVSPDATLLFIAERTHRRDAAGGEATLATYGDANREIAEASTDILSRDPAALYTESEMGDLWNNSGADTAHLEEADSSYIDYAATLNTATIDEVLAFSGGGFRTRSRNWRVR